MNADIVMRNTMTDSLRKALEDQKLELHYQPMVNAQTRIITGVEGLIRWKANDQEFVPTETLIQIAEESGLIIPLGNWVISEACRQYCEWKKAGIDLNRIAINVSAEQFRRCNVVQIVEEALLHFNVEPGNFEIEITEGVMMVDEDKTLEALEKLESLGVKISLDDFGTGFSSLSHVHRFPVDTLKIDRSFVTDIENNQGSRAIAVAVIALAHQLGMKVIGEGVENASQERILLENGCDEMQGYLYSKPLPAKEIVQVLIAGIQGS
jgi:EAL domain-containing protein (putative c-di-GMP-specific phosphodiesterase class I)